MIRNLVLTACILFSAIAATIYGVTYIRIGTVPYSLHLGRASAEAGRFFRDWGSSPPKRESAPASFHATEWREDQRLPCRIGSSASPGIYQVNSSYVSEFELWETAGFDASELNTYASDLLVRRASQVWDAPTGMTAPLAITASGAVLAASVFLLLSAVFRSMIVAFELPNRAARMHILSATVFAGSILCWFPKFALVGFVLTNPSIRWALFSPSWEPWSFAQHLLDYSLYHVAWALLISILCWFGIAAIASGLRFAAIRCPNARTLVAKSYRLLLWSVPFLVGVWFSLSILVSQPITWKVLLPLSLY